MVPNQEKKKEIIMQTVFVPIVKQTLILKMVEKKTFFMKPKHQCDSSQWVERAYDAQT